MTTLTLHLTSGFGISLANLDGDAHDLVADAAGAMNAAAIGATEDTTNVIVYSTPDGACVAVAARYLAAVMAGPDQPAPLGRLAVPTLVQAAPAGFGAGGPRR